MPKTKNYEFSQNRKCEYFPCHKGVNEENFNCLFCYCPLYMLKDECGGDFKKTNGFKDCSGCTKTHSSGGYKFVMSRMKLVSLIGSEF